MDRISKDRIDHKVKFGKRIPKDERHVCLLDYETELWIDLLICWTKLFYIFYLQWYIVIVMFTCRYFSKLWFALIYNTYVDCVHI